MPFNIETIKLMISKLFQFFIKKILQFLRILIISWKLFTEMFDGCGNAKIRLEEFGTLWNYVEQWQNCFRSFDQDGSGFIDAQELHLAFSTFGYRLSPFISSLMIKRFDRQNQGVLAFDDFIQCCVILHVRVCYADVYATRSCWLNCYPS